MTFATYGEHSPSHVQRHALLSQLYRNFKSFTYFFPSYETCSINVNSLFHAAIKNLHIKANGVFVFLLLHPPLLMTTTSEGITHTRKNTFLRPKVITNIYTRLKCLADEGVSVLKDWPAQSPDLDIVVGDLPMTRIMDLPKGYINQELSW